MVRVGLVTTEYPAFGVHGGIGTFVRDLAKGLAERGDAVTVLARSAVPRPARVRMDGVTVVPVRVRGDRLASRLGSVMPAFMFAMALARRIQHIEACEGPFDLIEVPDYLGAGFFLPFVTKTPLIVRLHGYSRLIRRLNGRAPVRGTRALEAMEHHACRRASLILAQSQALLECASRDFNGPGAPSAVVLPGIVAGTFQNGDRQAIRARWHIPEDASVLLFVGRLEQRKGVNELFEAWLKLFGAGYLTYLVLLGTETHDFGSVERLHHLARQAGCGHLLRLTGFIPHTHIHHWYAASDIFVAPSHFEPLGLVYLEAMAAGRAIVASATGGVPEILTHMQDAYLLPRVHPETIATAVRTLVVHPQLRRALGQNARRTVCQHLSVQAMAERTAHAYQRLLTQPLSNEPP